MRLCHSLLRIDSGIHRHHKPHFCLACRWEGAHILQPKDIVSQPRQRDTPLRAWPAPWALIHSPVHMQHAINAWDSKCDRKQTSAHVMEHICSVKASEILLGPTPPELAARPDLLTSASFAVARPSRSSLQTEIPLPRYISIQQCCTDPACSSPNHDTSTCHTPIQSPTEDCRTPIQSHTKNWPSKQLTPDPQEMPVPDTCA